MENIRAMQELLEQIYALSDPFAIFLENQLSQLSPFGWWQQCVVNKVNGHKNNDKYRPDPESFSDLDFYQMIQILFDNWYQLSNHSQALKKKYTQKNKKLLEDVQHIRNDIAHQDYYSGKHLDRFNTDCALLKHFSDFIDTDLETCIINLHLKEKTKILSYITKMVITPALNSTTLDEKTKASVLDTYTRLESVTRAREIVDFFYSALKGIRGKEVCSNLHNSKLLAFEDIKDNIKIMYFGE